MIRRSCCCCFKAGFTTGVEGSQVLKRTTQGQGLQITTRDGVCTELTRVGFCRELPVLGSAENLGLGSTESYHHKKRTTDRQGKGRQMGKRSGRQQGRETGTME